MKKRLKVMTFNVQHFRDFNYPNENRIDIDKFATYIANQNADIVGLNEVYNNGVTAEYSKQAYVVGEKVGFENIYFAEAVKLGGGQFSYGNALMSKYSFQGECISIPDPLVSELNGQYAETRCVLKAEFVIAGEKLTVLDCHFGLNDAEARNAVNIICEIVRDCANPIVLMGDFNQVPTSKLLAPLFELFEDTERLFEGDVSTYPSNDPTEKIDYIFVRRLKTVSAKVNKDIVSDHYSITAEVEFV